MHLVHRVVSRGWLNAGGCDWAVGLDRGGQACVCERFDRCRRVGICERFDGCRRVSVCERFDRRRWVGVCERFDTKRLEANNISCLMNHWIICNGSILV